MTEIAIVDYEAPEKIPALVDDVQGVYNSGKHGATAVPADKVAIRKRHIHEAAKYLGLSARFVDAIEGEDDTVTLVFRVGERRARKAKAAADSE